MFPCLTTHLGHVASGTNLEPAQCPRGGSATTSCMAAFLGLHLTPASTAYLEVSVLFVPVKRYLNAVSRVLGFGLRTTT